MSQQDTSVLTIERPLLLNGRNNQYHAPNVIGTLSVKTMFNGKAIYEAAGSQITVDDSRYLILNHAQPYTITIDAVEHVESFCVFYPESWAQDVMQGLTSPDEPLLVNPFAPEQPVLFYEIPHRHDDCVSPIMRRLMQYHKTWNNDSVYAECEGGWLEEQLYHLLAALLHVQRGVYKTAENLPAARQSTRIELFRRLALAQEFMLTNLHESLTIAEIAAVAYLSPYHFLRAFRDTFGQTPHAYLTQARLRKAADLLRYTRQPITAICLEIGFQSPGTFSSLFKQHYGLSPRAYRQQFV